MVIKRRKAAKALKTTTVKANPSQATKVIFDQPSDVRAIARERLGTVKPSQTILPKTARKKPKHKKPLTDDLNSL
jgi:hypothetical protein